MAVYVDRMTSCMANPNWPWDHACHLFADTSGELHAFARRLGLKRAWFQDKDAFPHYDLTVNKRRQAVEKGAIEVERKQVKAFIDRKRLTPS